MKTLFLAMIIGTTLQASDATDKDVVTVVKQAAKSKAAKHTWTSVRWWEVLHGDDAVIFIQEKQMKADGRSKAEIKAWVAAFKMLRCQVD